MKRFRWCKFHFCLFLTYIKMALYLFLSYIWRECYQLSKTGLIFVWNTEVTDMFVCFFHTHFFKYICLHRFQIWPVELDEKQIYSFFNFQFPDSIQLRGLIIKNTFDFACSDKLMSKHFLLPPLKYFYGHNSGTPGWDCCSSWQLDSRKKNESNTSLHIHTHIFHNLSPASAFCWEISHLFFCRPNSVFDISTAITFCLLLFFIRNLSCAACRLAPFPDVLS